VAAAGHNGASALAAAMRRQRCRPLTTASGKSPDTRAERATPQGEEAGLGRLFCEG